MKNKFHSLSRRIVAQLCIFTFVLSAIYSMLSFVLLYDLEDRFIEREVIEEANYLQALYLKSGHWPATRNNYMKLYFTDESLPDDINFMYRQEPLRKEFYGKEGRHYHLYPFQKYKHTYLVAEVSERLLVRPVVEGVLKLMLISSGTLLLIAFLIAWLLGRKTTKPLKQLADLVDGVAPEELPEFFADQFPNNEVGILARTLEQTMQRINQALTREKCFTRDVSHELRTPVAIIKNAIEVYQEQLKDKQDTQAVINRIADASIQMEQTVTTLLALAREEQAVGIKTHVKILPLIEQAIIDHGHLLNNKSVEVFVDDSCQTNVFAQAGLLKILLDNVLSNAFQYTDSGSVNINFTNNQLSIADSGLGIEAHISNKVMEPAVKGSTSTGYGFGLSIVKRLCDHQGWHLNVVSDNGTTILVSFN